MFFIYYDVRLKIYFSYSHHYYKHLSKKIQVVSFCNNLTKSLRKSKENCKIC